MSESIYEVRRPRWVPFAALALIPLQLLALIVAIFSLGGYAFVLIELALEWLNPWVALLLLIAGSVCCASLLALVTSSGKRFWVIAMAASAAVITSIVLIQQSDALFVLAIPFLFAAASLFGLGWTTRMFGHLADDDTWRKHYLDQNLCWHCGYSLEGLTGHRCPECGCTYSARESA